MAGIDQSWLSLLTNAILATLICATLWWATRSWRDRPPQGEVARALIVCVFVLGLGFILQPLLWELLIVPPPGPGSLYFLEYQPARAAKNLFLIWLTSGLVPGVALGILLTHSRLGVTLVGACIGAILVLIAYDLFLFTVAIRPELMNPTILNSGNLAAALSDAGYSLICDVIGGFLGGAACWLILRWLASNLRGGVGNYFGFTWHIMVGVFCVLVVSLGGYLIFLHPMPTNVRLDVGAYQSRTMTFSPLSAPARELLRQNHDPIVQKIMSSIAVAVPLSDVHIITLGLSDALRKQWGAENSEARLSLLLDGDGHGAPIKAEIIGALGCATPKAALDVARGSSSSGKEVDLNHVTATMEGFAQELQGFASKEQMAKATIYVPRDQMLMQVAQRPDDAAIVPTAGTLEIPATPGTAVVLSAIPDVITGIFMNGVDAARDMAKIPPVSISLRSGSEVQRLLLPHNIPDNGACQFAPFLSGDAEKGTLPLGATWEKGDLIFLIREADPLAVLKIPLNILAALHFSSPKDEPLFSGLPLAVFEVKPRGGNLTIGDRHYQLRPGDEVQLAAVSAGFLDMPDGSFALDGSSRYVLLNGQLITTSLWTSVDPTFRHSLELAFVTAIGWAIKRHWDFLLTKAKQIWGHEAEKTQP